MTYKCKLFGYCTLNDGKIFEVMLISDISTLTNGTIKTPYHPTIPYLSGGRGYWSSIAFTSRNNGAEYITNTGTFFSDILECINTYGWQINTKIPFTNPNSKNQFTLVLLDMVGVLEILFRKYQNNTYN